MVRGLSTHCHAWKGSWQSLRLKEEWNRTRLIGDIKTAVMAVYILSFFAVGTWVVCPLRKFSTQELYYIYCSSALLK